MDNILEDIVEYGASSQAVQKRIASQFKRQRLDANLSQQDIANKSGVSYGSVKRFENSGEISLKHLLMLAVVLDALIEFKSLFSLKKNETIDDILKSRERKPRKRARNA